MARSVLDMVAQTPVGMVPWSVIGMVSQWSWNDVRPGLVHRAHECLEPQDKGVLLLGRHPLQDSGDELRGLRVDIVDGTGSRCRRAHQHPTAVARVA